MGEKKTGNPQPDWGEGDYEAAREFDAQQAEFAKSGKVGAKAKEAEAALDGPEGAALEAARKAAAEGKSVKPA
jgi:hypothetical protein